MFNFESCLLPGGISCVLCLAMCVLEAHWCVHACMYVLCADRAVTQVTWDRVPLGTSLMLPSQLRASNISTYPCNLFHHGMQCSFILYDLYLKWLQFMFLWYLLWAFACFWFVLRVNIAWKENQCMITAFRPIDTCEIVQYLPLFSVFWTESVHDSQYCASYSVSYILSSCSSNLPASRAMSLSAPSAINLEHSSPPYPPDWDSPHHR